MATRKRYSFTINIYPSGESFVECLVSDRELQLIQEASDAGEDFEDVEELEWLYERVMRSAKEKLKEDVELSGDDIDVDDLDFSVGFGEEVLYL